MLEQLLAYAGSSVLGLFEFGDPVVDAGIKLAKGFFLFEDALVRELCNARTAEVGTNPLVQVAAAGTKGTVGFAKIVTALVQASEFPR